MKLAKGDYKFLNSDDVYTDNALELLNIILKNPSKDLFLGLLKNIGEFIWL